MDSLEMLEVKQHIQSLMEWREAQRLAAQLPKRPSPIKQLARWLAASINHAFRSRTAAQPLTPANSHKQRRPA